MTDRGDGQERLWRRRADASGQPSTLTGPIDADQMDMGFWSLDQVPIVAGGPNGLNAVDVTTFGES